METGLRTTDQDRVWQRSRRAARWRSSANVYLAPGSGDCLICDNADNAFAISAGVIVKPILPVATAPSGMPSQRASACAKVCPRAAFTAASAEAPSLPRPERITAMARDPRLSAREHKKTLSVVGQPCRSRVLLKTKRASLKVNLKAGRQHEYAVGCEAHAMLDLTGSH